MIIIIIIIIIFNIIIIIINIIIVIIIIIFIIVIIIFIIIVIVIIIIDIIIVIIIYESSDMNSCFSCRHSHQEPEAEPGVSLDLDVNEQTTSQSESANPVAAATAESGANVVENLSVQSSEVTNQENEKLHKVTFTPLCFQESYFWSFFSVSMVLLIKTSELMKFLNVLTRAVSNVQQYILPSDIFPTFLLPARFHPNCLLAFCFCFNIYYGSISMTQSFEMFSCCYYLRCQFLEM